MEENKTSSSSPKSKKDKSKLITPIAIIVSAIILGVAIYFTPQSTKAPTADSNTTVTQGSAANADIKKVSTANEPFIGDPNAKATMALWTDFQCPFCKQFELGSMTTIINTYVTTNKVKIVFKDFAFLGNDSVTAAYWGRAVWELYPEKYFDWRTAIYQAQDGENSGFGNEKTIIALTQKISGIDTNKVKQAVAAKAAIYQKQIDADKAEGAALGVTGTPGTIIGTQLISGAAPFTQFSTALDAQLK